MQIADRGSKDEKAGLEHGLPDTERSFPPFRCPPDVLRSTLHVQLTSKSLARVPDRALSHFGVSWGPMCFRRRYVFVVAIVLLSARVVVCQSTTFSALVGNNTAACSASGAPSYCQAAFTAMADSTSGIYNPIPSNVSAIDIHTLLYPGANTSMFTFFQPWFCMAPGSTATGSGTLCDNHIQTGYVSNNSATVNGQIGDMIQRGFDGMLIDYFGTDQTIAPNYDATVIKAQTNLASRCSGSQSCPFYFALMEDDGAFKFDKCPYNGQGTDQTQCIVTALNGDLDYMSATYFGSNAYLKVDSTTGQISPSGVPLVLFFVCEECFINPSPDWTSIWTQVRSHTNSYGNSAPALLLIFRNGTGFSHVQANGGFAWVNWYGGLSSDPYGLLYLDNFYNSAAAALQGNPGLITIGATWKGFDESNAPWVTSNPRISQQQCGITWMQTFAQMSNNSDFGSGRQLPFASIVTWNDYEEGTEIETGIDNCLALSGSVSGTILSWKLNFSSTSGSESTVHHYVLYDSSDGQNLTQLGTFSPGTHSVDLRTFTLAPGSHIMYVQAVGQPSIQNRISNAISYTSSAALTITTVSLPNGVQNVAYNVTLQATGGQTPYNWSISTGTLPAGLTLNSSTGVISGKPTATGTSSFTVQVTDSLSQSATQALIITVNLVSISRVQSNAVASSGVSSLSTSFPAANAAGNLIIAFVRMSTTSQAVSVSDSAGNVYNLAVSQAQASGNFQTQIFYAANIKGGANTVQATFSSTNSYPFLAIYEYHGVSTLDQTAAAQGSSSTPNSGSTTTTASANELVFAGLGLAYNSSATVSPGSGYTLEQQDAVANTGRAATEDLLATASGNYAASFTLSSSTDWSAVVATFVASSSPSPLSITTANLPAGTQNVAYSTTLQASGGQTPYAWSISAGALPAGLNLNSSTGAISGAPTATGVSNFTVQVTDANANSASKAFSITVSAASGGGISLLQTGSVQGSSVNSLSTAFPSANAAGNLIVAFVRMSTTSQTVSLSDSAGNVYNLAVSQAQASGNFQTQIFYAANIKGGANTVQATFSSTNSYPFLAIYEYHGVSILDQTAAAQGSSSTPNSGSTTTTASANELVFAGLGLAYNSSATVSPGSGYTLEQQDAVANTGRAATEDLLAAASGNYAASFTLSSSTDWSAVVATFVASSSPSPLSITTANLPAGTQSVAYSATLRASGGQTPYAWSVSAGALPAGLNLNASTGAITGTPSAAGVSNFTVQLTDANADSATKPFSITVNAASGGIALLQTGSVQGSSVNFLATAFPSANTAGNLIIAFVRMSTTSQTVSLSDSAGNVYRMAVNQAQASGNFQTQIFYAANIKGGANTVQATFSSSNSYPFLAIYEYHGVSTLDQTAAAQGSSSTPNSGSTATTASADELVFAGLGLAYNSSATVSPGSRYTMEEQDTTVNGPRAASEDAMVTTTGSFSGTFTLNSTAAWSCVVATFK